MICFHHYFHYHLFNVFYSRKTPHFQITFKFQTITKYYFNFKNHHWMCLLAFLHLFINLRYSAFPKNNFNYHFIVVLIFLENLGFHVSFKFQTGGKYYFNFRNHYWIRLLEFLHHIQLIHYLALSLNNFYYHVVLFLDFNWSFGFESCSNFQMDLQIDFMKFNSLNILL